MIRLFMYWTEQSPERSTGPGSVERSLLSYTRLTPTFIPVYLAAEQTSQRDENTKI